MALYPKAVLKLIKPDARDPLIDPELAVLHVDAGNASSLYDWWLKSGDLECHFFIKRSGVVEQYVDTKWQADAQVGGAYKAISIETQGYGAGEWTPEQLAAIKDLLLWLHHEEGIPLKVPANPYDSGVGYHSMFASSVPGTWARDGRTCPGPDRIRQYRTVLIPWMSNPTAAPQEDDMPTPAEVFKADVIAAPNPSTSNPTWSAETYLRAIYRNSVAAFQNAAAARAIAEEQAKAGRPLTTEEVEAAAQKGAKAALDDKIAGATTVLEVKP